MPESAGMFLLPSSHCRLFRQTVEVGQARRLSMKDRIGEERAGGTTCRGGKLPSLEMEVISH